MSDKNPTPAAPAQTAITKIPTIDDVLPLLKVDERTSTGQEGHDDQGGGAASVAWIGFRSNKSKARLEELVAAKVEENTFYIYDQGIIYPKPFYVNLLYAFHYYSKVDKENNVVAASAVLNPDLRKQGFSDHLNALLFVRLPGDTPVFKLATFSQRKAMTRALDSIRSVVGKFEGDKEGREWKARGPAASAAFTAAKWPQFAVRAKIWGKLAPSQTPGGEDYNLGLSAIEPTPEADVRALNRFVGAEAETYKGENKKYTELSAAVKLFLQRTKEARDLIAKTK